MNNMRFSKKTALFPFLVLLLLASLGVAQKNVQAEVELQAAENKQLVDGDLEQAIELYKKILSQYPQDRPIAAKALVEMGNCYEELGKSEARQDYERVLRDYADQSAEVNEARARLGALEQGAHSTELVTRRVWTGPEADSEGSASPDGQFLTYVDWDTNNVAIYDVASGEKRDVTHYDPNSGDIVFSPKLSPDGKRIAYEYMSMHSFLTDLRVIGVDGSGPGLIWRGKDSSLQISPSCWSPDGKTILGEEEKTGVQGIHMVLVSVADGIVRILKTLGGPADLAMSPDGRYIAYDYPQQKGSNKKDIAILSVNGRQDIPVVENSADDELLGWAPDGKDILFASDRTGSVSAWAIHVADGRPQGSPVLVKPDIGRIDPMGFTRNGSFYYGVLTSLADVYTAELDPETGKLLRPSSPLALHFMGRVPSTEFSPDGKSLAYFANNFADSGMVSGNPTLYFRSLKTGEERQLSPNLWLAFDPRWSADGRSILVQGLDDDRREGIFLIDSQDGKVTPVLYRPPDTYCWQQVWTLGGKAILYVRNDFAAKISSILLRDLRTGSEKEIYHAPIGGVMSLDISPDGKQLAFVAADIAGKVQSLNVLPATGGVARELLVPKGKGAGNVYISDVSWMPDGRSILFVTIEPPNANGAAANLWRISAEGGQPQDLGILARGANTASSLRIRPDGREIAFASARYKRDVWVMKNFLPALKASR